MAHRVSTSGTVGVLFVTFVILGVFLMTKQTMAQGEEVGRMGYACWGGCYNQCIIASGKPPSLPCYFTCLEGCVFRPTAAEYGNYCQLGCSLVKCIKHHPDGKNVENCLNHCSTKICANNT